MASISSNLNKPDNKKLKMIANTMLYTLPLVITTIISSPLSDNIQTYSIFGLNIIIIGFKAFTKFTTNTDV